MATIAGRYGTILPMDQPGALTPRTPFELPQWLWITAIWFAFGLLDATQNVFNMRAEGMHHNWTSLFFTLLLNWMPLAIATPFVLRVGHWSALSLWKGVLPWAANLGACAAIGLVSAAWTALLESLLNPYAIVPGPAPFRALWIHNFQGGLLAYLIFYSAIVLVSRILDSRERLAHQQTETARLNEQLTRAQLDALRRQIEPHFLFNSLNAIAGLVREKRTDDAVNTIAGLSDFLRHVVEDSDRQQVSLREELLFLSKYLEIQKVRFAERLQFSVDVPEQLLSAQVPSLILQPMVENAVKHGIALLLQGGSIRISASRTNGMITLSVYNDGPSLSATSKPTRNGIGISNVRDRLQALYGDAFVLTMADQEPGGVLVSLSLPLISRPDVGDDQR